MTGKRESLMNLSELYEPWAGDVVLDGGRIVLLLGRLEDRLFGIPSRSVHATITDGPYHLKSIVERFGKEGSKPPVAGDDHETHVFRRQARGFMGQKWDGGDVAFRLETWAECWRLQLPGSWLLNFTAPRTYHRITCAIEDGGFEIRDFIDWLYGTGFPSGSKNLRNKALVTLIKPAHEPITVGRKPLEEKSNKAQFEATGTGFLNNKEAGAPGGRWVPNVVIDDYIAGLLGEKATPFPKFRYQAKPTVKEKEAGLEDFESGLLHRVNPGGLEDEARFAPVERKNTHSTVKPLELMRWLVRLACPKDGIVLDPFMGSGTTGVAAALEGRRFVGVEMDPKYFEIAAARIKFGLKGRMFQ